jgi:hypothetical protein
LHIKTFGKGYLLYSVTWSQQRVKAEMKKMIENREIIKSSFRDPSGFVFSRNGKIYRQINICYKDHYEFLMKSELYKALVNEELLTQHQEEVTDSSDSKEFYKIIKPNKIDFISYPYEWCFSQLKDAAMVTLQIQKRALDFGMSLKDCSAYNIQFQNGKPIFIDTLSFQRYHEGEPWVAYRQFCQHFLAPLALMSYVDFRLNQLFRTNIDGIPLDLASSLLPFWTHAKYSLLTHILLHAKFQKHFADKPVKRNHRNMSLRALRGLIGNLESAIKNLNWKAGGTEWADYYGNTNYTPNAFNHKKQIVTDLIDKLSPRGVWDLGGNVGTFSRISSNRGIPTICFDIDQAAVELNYLKCTRDKEGNILPLLLDLTNPSPAVGWQNKERVSLWERGPTDTVLALALIHHLAISNNVPLARIASMLSKICKSLIIEFIPKDDSQVQRLLASREDVFSEYSQRNFEKEFSKIFKIKKLESIKESKRLLYLMEQA